MTQAKLTTNFFVAFLALISLLTFFIYMQGAHGPFLYDDFPSLSALGLNGGISSFKEMLNFVLGNNTGYLGRPVSMASFLLNAQNWPTDPFIFKLTNILIHISNGWLIYFFSYTIIKKLDNCIPNRTVLALSVLTASLWLLHPLHVSTTLYTIQRMAQLSTLFSLFSIIIFLKYHSKLTRALSFKEFAIPSIALFITITLAIFSKENGILVFPILILIHYLIKHKETTLIFRIWYLLMVITPAIITLIYFIDFINSSAIGYEFKGFTLQERLLTELRVVSEYIFQIVIPDVSIMNIFHDDFSLSSSFFKPLSTFLSFIFLSSALIVAWFCRNPVYKLSILWFFIWHLLESTTIPLYLYFEHRNYMASIGLILGIVYGLYKISEHLSKNIINLRYLFVILVIAIQAYNLSVLTKVWASEETIYLHGLKGHEKSKLTFLSLIQYYENQGDINLAYQLTSEGIKYEHFQNDLGIYLKIYTHQCILKQETAGTMQKLLNLSSSKNSYGDTVLHLITTISLNISANACKPENFDQLDLLLKNIAKNAPQKISVNWLKELHEKHAYILLADKNYTQALNMFTKAYRANKPDVNLAIIDLNIKLKNYTVAEKWLNLAKKNISVGNYGVRDISGDLDKLRLKLNIATGK